MNENTNPNAPAEGEPNPADGAKTFTQEDVNRIVQDRLARDRTKAETELAQREQLLQQRELMLTVKETLTEKGLPHELLEAMNCSSKEAFEKSLAIIDKLIKSNTKLPRGFQIGANAQPNAGANGDPLREAMGLQ